MVADPINFEPNPDPAVWTSFGSGKKIYFKCRHVKLILFRTVCSLKIMLSIKTPRNKLCFSEFVCLGSESKKTKNADSIQKIPDNKRLIIPDSIG
jgi:hypothetical protein